MLGVRATFRCQGLCWACVRGRVHSKVKFTKSTDSCGGIFCHAEISARREGSWLLHVRPLLLSDGRRLISMFCRHRRPPRVTCPLAALTSSPLLSLCSALPVSGIGSTLVFFLPAGFFNLGWIFTVCRSRATFFDVLPRPPRRLLLLRLGWNKQRGRWARIDSACNTRKREFRMGRFWGALCRTFRFKSIQTNQRLGFASTKFR